MPYGLILFAGFWIAAIRLWFRDGAKIPLICIGVWLGAYFGVPRLHWPGMVFMGIECFLGVILLLIDRYKSALR
jgi:hypothetical protein